MIVMQFAGRLGKDAEVRRMQGGETVTSFSVGCNAGKDKTVWVECAMFGDRGQKLAPYLRKGTPVAGNGRPSVRAWKDKQGNERADQQCAVFDIALLGSKNDGNRDDDRGGHGGGSAPQGGAGGFDDEIPFAPEWR